MDNLTGFSPTLPILVLVRNAIAINRNVYRMVLSKSDDFVPLHMLEIAILPIFYIIDPYDLKNGSRSLIFSNYVNIVNTFLYMKYQACRFA